jgi:hypothetical protein
MEEYPNLIPAKPGEVRNPKGNADRHSTRPISTLIREYFERGCQDLDIKEKFKSKKAKEALVEALLEKAIGSDGVDTRAMSILLEYGEGKPETKVDITTKGDKVESAPIARLNEMIEAIKKDA